MFVLIVSPNCVSMGRPPFSDVLYKRERKRVRVLVFHSLQLFETWFSIWWCVCWQCLRVGTKSAFFFHKNMWSSFLMIPFVSLCSFRHRSDHFKTAAWAKWKHNDSLDPRRRVQHASSGCCWLYEWIDFAIRCRSLVGVVSLFLFVLRFVVVGQASNTAFRCNFWIVHTGEPEVGTNSVHK